MPEPAIRISAETSAWESLKLMLALLEADDAEGTLGQLNDERLLILVVFQAKLDLVPHRVAEALVIGVPEHIISF